MNEFVQTVTVGGAYGGEPCRGPHDLHDQGREVLCVCAHVYVGVYVYMHACM